MATTPEYGEEELVRERREEAEEKVRHLLPTWEDIGESEIEEHQHEEERLRRPATKDS